MSARAMDIGSGGVTLGAPARRHWSSARAWQTNAVLAGLGAILFLLSHHLPLEYDSFTIGFSGVSGWSLWCYLLACGLVLFGPTDRLTFPLILTFGVLCRLAVLYADPYLSSDIYRYVWDGMVQHAGINPYRYVPADPALAFLRGGSDGAIYPEINRATYAHTIYPPFAQALFWGITFLAPTITCMKTVFVLCEGLTLWALVRILAHLGRPREQAILYAWCPLLIWEIAASGHLDAVVMALTMMAVLFRLRRRRTLTGVFLGLAVLTKFYPLVLFPALYLLWPERAKDAGGSAIGRLAARLDWGMPGVMAGMAVALYAAYASVGKAVFGFLGGYVSEEGLQTGTRYFLLEQAQRLPGLGALSSASYNVFAGLVMLSLAGWAFARSNGLGDEVRFGNAGVRRGRLEQVYAGDDGAGRAGSVLVPAMALAWALMLLFSPHYPWYLAWLVPFLVLVPNVPLAAYTLGFFYLCYTALAVGVGPKQFLLNQILYGGVAVGFATEWAMRRWPRYRGLTAGIWGWNG